jgi:DNA-directed RNA polymerase subunit alpha
MKLTASIQAMVIPLVTLFGGLFFHRFRVQPLLRLKISGVSHEFSTIEGVKEDVITMLLNLKKVRIQMITDEPQVLRLKIKGVKEVTAGDIEAGGQIQILNPELMIAHVTGKTLNSILK